MKKLTTDEFVNKGRIFKYNANTEIFTCDILENINKTIKEHNDNSNKKKQQN